MLYLSDAFHHAHVGIVFSFFSFPLSLSSSSSCPTNIAKGFKIKPNTKENDKLSTSYIENYWSLYIPLTNEENTNNFIKTSIENKQTCMDQNHQTTILCVCLPNSSHIFAMQMLFQRIKWLRSSTCRERRTNISDRACEACSRYIYHAMPRPTVFHSSKKYLHAIFFPTHQSWSQGLVAKEGLRLEI